MLLKKKTLKLIIFNACLLSSFLSTAAPIYQIQLPLKGLVVSSDKGVEGIEDFGGYRARPNGSTEASCKDYRSTGGYSGSTGDGVYRIKPQGGGTVDVWCDMTSDGGGWTRVVRQYTGDAVPWTGGESGRSYVLTERQIPAHSQVGFGKDDSAIDIDYVAMDYTVGDIDAVLVLSPMTGKQYHVYRSASYYHYNHDPDQVTKYYSDNDGDWRNTLSLDIAGSRGLEWSFSANQSDTLKQGHAYKGFSHGSSQSYAWTLWVR